MLQNQGKVYIANFSGIDASSNTVTTTTKPVAVGTSMTAVNVGSTPKPLPTLTSSTTTRPPATTTVTPTPMAIPPAVVIAPPPALGGGGMGGGAGSAGEEKATEQGAGAIGGGHNMEIIGYSSFAFVAGAVAGYLIGKKMKKNPWVFAGIGGVALGLATYGVTTKFVYPAGEQTSGFLGLTKRRKKVDRDKDVTGKYPTGNAGRKQCELDGGTVVFPNSGGWYCDIKK